MLCSKIRLPWGLFALEVSSKNYVAERSTVSMEMTFSWYKLTKLPPYVENVDVLRNLNKYNGMVGNFRSFPHKNILNIIGFVTKCL